MKWIGITGSIGTGKTTVSEIIRAMGFTVLDADALSKQQLLKNQEGYRQVLKAFGEAILDVERNIDKNKLANIVFGSKQELQKLENIIHPLIQKKILQLKKQHQEKGDQALFYDVPLLFEKNMQESFDAIILVSASESIQYERIRKRNNWSDEEIKRRLKNQMSLEEKRKISQYIIENDSNVEHLKQQTQMLLKKIL